VRIVARRSLRDFWEAGHADARRPLEAWYAKARKAEWTTSAEVKRDYARASIVDAERIVFNIGGNKYRLVVKVWFKGQAIYIKFVGTHDEYDQIDVTKL
jgi:mRNA interferase HigB